MRYHALIVMFVFLLASCSTHHVDITTPIDVTTTRTKDAPAWIDNEDTAPDLLTVTGIAQPNPLSDKSMQRTEALANARTKLAQKISVRVEALFEQLNQHMTTGRNDRGEDKLVRSDVMARMIKETTRQITDVELSGASARQYWTDPQDGTLYVMMILSKETLNKTLTTSAGNAIRKEIAQGAAELKDALASLDEALATVRN